MNKLGIIGGMGPLATNIFYNRIIEHTKTNSEQEHIYTIISSHSTIPDRTFVILNNLSHDIVLKAVSEYLKIMEHAGVKRIVIPCNTFHYFYDEIQGLTDIKIINMIDETLKDFRKNLGKRACVLSTLGTKKSKIYNEYAIANDIEVIDLDETISTRINNIIYRIKSTNNVEEPELLDIMDDISFL